MKPKISIITVSYNSASTIEETICSVITQDYDNLEYIVVDGASTDDTISIINKYKDSISLFVSEPDNGISDAFNKGIQLATGDIIGILNSDDVMLPNALSRLANYYDETIDVYRGNTVIWNPESNLKVREIPSMKFPKVPINIKVSHQGTFITSAAYKKYGMFKNEYKHIMDLELLCRFYRNNVRMKYVDVDVALFRMGGITSTPLFKKKDQYMNLVLDNGGSMFSARMYYSYLCFIDYLKKVLNFIGGDDLKKKLRYGKMTNR